MNTSAWDTVRFQLAITLMILVLLGGLIVLPAWSLLVCVASFAVWLGVTRIGQQAWSVTKVAVATIPRRLGASAVVMVGIAGVVGVLIAVMAMGAGFERTLRQTGSEDTVLLLQVGQRNEISSSLSDNLVALASQLPQVSRDTRGQPIASAEQLLSAQLPKKSTGLDASVAIRGVAEHVWALWPRVRMIAGRPFQPGLRELVVGMGAHEKFAGLDIGSTLAFDNESWRVVGLFNSDDAHNSEVWGDSRVLAAAYHRDGTANSLTVRLVDAHSLDELKAAVLSDPRLKVEVQTTRQYYNQQSETFARMIRIVGTAIGLIMALGAMFGALNATYMAVAGRAREIATLRAIGFQRAPVILSVLMETMLIATVGGVIGAVFAWLIFDGITASTAGTSGQVVFAFTVSPQLLGDGLKWALAIGFIGGLLPAARAARLGIATGLRER